MTAGFRSVSSTEAFKRDFKRLDPQTKRYVEECIQDILQAIIPERRRFHCIDQGRPKVFSVDVTTNKAYKLSLQIEEGVAILRRVGTHVVIDRVG